MPPDTWYPREARKPDAVRFPLLPFSPRGDRVCFAGGVFSIRGYVSGIILGLRILYSYSVSLWLYRAAAFSCVRLVCRHLSQRAHNGKASILSMT